MVYLVGFINKCPPCKPGEQCGVLQAPHCSPGLLGGHLSPPSKPGEQCGVLSRIHKQMSTL